MIDLKTVAAELHAARLARIEAQAALADLEDLMLEIREGGTSAIRIIAGADAEQVLPH